MTHSLHALLVAISTLALAAPAARADDAGARPGEVTGPALHIKHIVLIVQENRSTDNLFHGLPGADTASHGVNSKGEKIALQPLDLKTSFDLGHIHRDFVRAYNDGKMNGSDHIDVRCGEGVVSCAPHNPWFTYVKTEDVAPYFQMATEYVFGDRMFQSNQGPTFPAHQYIIAGTSDPGEQAGYPGYLVAGNPVPLSPTGCVDAPPRAIVRLISPQGNQDAKIYPCFEHQTMMDLLDAAGHTWRYYTPSTDGLQTGPNGIAHLREGPDWKNVIVPPAQVLTDIQQGQLADVVWVMPNGKQSDHPLTNDGTGPSWVASVVNAIGESDYWADTAIFVTWDDWGGFYDHVPPPIYSSYENGFRVPLIVISPFAKQGYVSHRMHDFGSLLHFIEWTYGLPSLGYEDARSDNLDDCFDFRQAPRAFHPIKAPHDAAYFILRAAFEPPQDADPE
jgi:phospholipase C